MGTPDLELSVAFWPVSVVGENDGIAPRAGSREGCLDVRNDALGTIATELASHQFIEHVDHKDGSYSVSRSFRQSSRKGSFVPRDDSVVDIRGLRRVAGNSDSYSFLPQATAEGVERLIANRDNDAIKSPKIIFIPIVLDYRVMVLKA
jgi:hypothetical protein